MKIVNIAIIAISMMSIASALASDAGTGETVYNNKGCSGCHGAGGDSQIPAYPKLTGKDADYIKKTLTDFKSGTRKNPTMNAMAAMLSNEDIANIAAYLGTRK